MVSLPVSPRFASFVPGAAQPEPMPEAVRAYQRRAKTPISNQTSWQDHGSYLVATPCNPA
jgi:hypothetical protein